MIRSALIAAAVLSVASCAPLEVGAQTNSALTSAKKTDAKKLHGAKMSPQMKAMLQKQQKSKALRPGAMTAGGGGCMPESGEICDDYPESNWQTFDWERIDEITGQAERVRVQLETVQISGKSSCGVWVGPEGGEMFFELPDCDLSSATGQNQVLDGARGGSLTQLQQQIDLHAKAKASQCFSAPARSYENDAPNFFAASHAIATQKNANLNVGDLAEVRYEDGRSYTFELNSAAWGNHPPMLTLRYVGGGLDPQCPANA